ncbi:MAG: hypothetical protein HYU57_04515 [Micavibrio aeruginosavorus]|nr:hypothetical protein [Micavibrio aeruginosavorus]
MKQLIQKVHHFTRRELLLEEIVIILFCLLFWAAAFAATALVPVQVNIINCGTRAELPARCEADARCCALLKGNPPFRGRSTPSGTTSGSAGDPENTITLDPDAARDKDAE